MNPDGSFLPGVMIFAIAALTAQPGRLCPAAWACGLTGLRSEYVWPRPTLLRWQLDQACVLDPAASADPEFPAELERCADRPAPGDSLRHQGRGAQPGPVALGPRPVLGQGHKGRFRQYQRQGGRDRDQA